MYPAYYLFSYKFYIEHLLVFLFYRVTEVRPVNTPGRQIFVQIMIFEST